MLPIHLNYGFGIFHFYEGFYFLVSIAFAYGLIVWRLKKEGLDAEVFTASLIWILLGAFLGARVFHFVFWDVHSLATDPLAFLRFWEGGMSITGGLAGGGLAAFIYYRRSKEDFWHHFAVGSPAVIVGQAVGRVGCFLNGDAWGIPTRLPWGVSLPKFGTVVPNFVIDNRTPSEVWLWTVSRGYTSPAALKTVPLHPTQIYEGLGDLLLAGVILLMLRSMKGKDASWSKVFWVHFGGYSFLRFALEFLHGDRDATIWAGMTALQIALLVFGVVSAAWLYTPKPRTQFE